MREGWRDGGMEGGEGRLLEAAPCLLANSTHVGRLITAA